MFMIVCSSVQILSWDECILIIENCNDRIWFNQRIKVKVDENVYIRK